MDNNLINSNLIIIAYFTAFSRKLEKVFDTDDEVIIRKELNDICETYILHSIITYEVKPNKVTEFSSPFEPKKELSEKLFNK